MYLYVYKYISNIYLCLFVCEKVAAVVDQSLYIKKKRKKTLRQKLNNCFFHAQATTCLVYLIIHYNRSDSIHIAFVLCTKFSVSHLFPRTIWLLFFHWQVGVGLAVHMPLYSTVCIKASYAFRPPKGAGVSSYSFMAIGEWFHSEKNQFGSVVLQSRLGLTRTWLTLSFAC